MRSVVGDEGSGEPSEDASVGCAAGVEREGPQWVVAHVPGRRVEEEETRKEATVIQWS
jgi:hypothetical protein